MTSIIQVFLPSMNINEREKFNTATQIPAKYARGSTTDSTQKQISQSIKIASLFLNVAKDSAEALLHDRFTAFDALVKNCGCQITALEVQQLVRDRSLLEEADQLKTSIPILQSKLKKLNNHHKQADESALSLVNLLHRVLPELAFCHVSPAMMRLMRFRLLAIVNDNEPDDNEREIPITNINPLAKSTKLDERLLKTLISGLQVEESRHAIDFIQQEASLLPGEHKRKGLICRALHCVRQNKMKGDNTPISFTSLLYNVEACLRCFQGIVLVKNKLTLCKQPIPSAFPLQVYIRMPGEEVLTQKEVKEISENEPLIVIEGYVKTPELAAKIQQIGLVAFVKINASHAAIQFPEDCAQPMEAEFEQDRQDLEKLRPQIAKIFEIDHMFCSSMREEACTNALRGNTGTDTQMEERIAPIGALSLSISNESTSYEPLALCYIGEAKK
ncbi:MAG: hypothetical protein WCF65_10175 [Parachlamydiaceae bacterium]